VLTLSLIMKLDRVGADRLKIIVGDVVVADPVVVVVVVVIPTAAAGKNLGLAVGVSSGDALGDLSFGDPLAPFCLDRFICKHRSGWSL